MNKLAGFLLLLPLSALLGGCGGTGVSVQDVDTVHCVGSGSSWNCSSTVTVQVSHPDDYQFALSASGSTKHIGIDGAQTIQVPEEGGSFTLPLAGTSDWCNDGHVDLDVSVTLGDVPCDMDCDPHGWTEEVVHARVSCN